MARVGQARGANDMHALATAILSAITAAAGIGVSAAAVLWLCRDHMLDVTSVSSSLATAGIAREYAPFALAALPPRMLLAACRSILVGFGALGTASSLAATAAVADAATFSILLVFWGRGLPAAAAGSLGVTLVAAAAGLCLILRTAPPPLRLRLLPHLPGIPTAVPAHPFLRPRHPASHAEATRLQPEHGLARHPSTGRGGGAEPQSHGGSEAPPARRSILSPAPGSLLSLARDSGDMFTRSLLLSSSFLGLAAAVGYCGGAPALAAHAVVAQLWMIT
eukprot:scaffold9454_cov93-Isochrysis_galbana.AAC.1